MTLVEKLLQRLADWQPAEGRQTLGIADEDMDWAVSLTADRFDSLGCLVWEITLRRTGSLRVQPGGPSPQPLSPSAGERGRGEGASEELHAWANNVAQRVTGLLEPLKVVEVDTLRNQALLRSQAPARRGNDLFYYEIILTGLREAHVRRYQAAQVDRPSPQPLSPAAGERGRGEGREQIAFALTCESLAKLAGDLIADR